MKQSKHMLCAALAFLMIFLAIPFPASAGEILYIRSTADFAAFAEACSLDQYSTGLQVVLTEDLDFSGIFITPVPIFHGRFDGQGHQMTGLHFKGEGSFQGLFRYLGPAAVVTNLSLEAELLPAGSAKIIGILAGQNEGLIENCSVSGTLHGTEDIGGITGLNKNTGTLRSCTSNAEVKGELRTGGIAGKNEGVIEDCQNYGSVNVHNDSTYIDTGGICGFNSGTIRRTQNYGAAGYAHTGYNTGGIAGLQGGLLLHSVNYGNIKGRRDTGGIAGQFDPHIELAYGQSTMDILNEEIGELTDILRDLAAEVDTAAADAAGHLKDVSDSLNTAADTGIDTINEEVQALADTYHLLDEQFNAIHTTFDDLKTEGESALTDISQDVESLLTSVRKLRRALTEGIDSVDSQTSKVLTELSSTLTDIETEIETIRTAVSSIREALNKLKIFLTEAAEIMNNPTATIIEKVQSLSQAYQKMGSIDIAGEIQKIIAATGNLATHLKQFADIIEASYPKLHAAISNLLDDINSHANDLNISANYLNDDINLLSTLFLDKFGAVNDSLNLITSTLDGYADETAGRFDISSENIKDNLDTVKNNLDQMIDALSASGDRIHSTTEKLFDQFDQIRRSLTKQEAPEFTMEDADGLSEIEEGKGMILNCKNFAAVESDYNAGGITGYMAVELYKDPEEDWNPIDSMVVDTTAFVTAVIHSCENNGTITAKKDYVGGIAGRSRLGTAVNCINTGDITAAEGSYCGGIIGKSQTNIAQCSSLGTLSGNSYVGGISGEGNNIISCRTMVTILSDGECLGAISGSAQGNIEDNYFIKNTLDGIDNISYAGKAEPLAADAFFAHGDLPPVFTAFEVVFLADGEPVKTITIPYGEALPADEIPPVPDKPDQTGSWAAFDQTDIHQNLRIEAVYTPYVKVLSTTEPLPLLLAEGSFLPGTKLNLTEWAFDSDLIPSSYRAAGGWQISLSKPSAENTVIFHLRNESGKQKTCIGILQTDSLEIIEARQDGSYLVFEAPADCRIMVLHPNNYRPVILIPAVLLVIIGGFLLRRHRYKHKK